MAVKKEQESQYRLKTGIEGLDGLMEGGLVRGDIHLLAGGPGTGKTIIATNFAYNAALSGETVVYATFEESSEYFRRNARALGLDLPAQEKAGRLAIIDLEALRGKELETNIALLIDATKEAKGTALVIDSVTALLLACDTQFEMRTFMKSVYGSLKQQKITTVMTGSLGNGNQVGLEAFMTDSVMLAENWTDDLEMKTRFVILKMRGTNHSKRYHSVIFGPRLAISRF
jgi:KaiC/GvpD/RAD55 family RecA-like ATPase